MQGPAPVNELRETEAHVSPRAHVSRLLLQPNYLFQIGIALEHRAQVLFGKGIELLDAAESDGPPRPATVARDQVDVHLAAREDQAPHLARELPGPLVVDDSRPPALRPAPRRRAPGARDRRA